MLKEIDISNLEFLDKEIEVEAGDKIIYDGNKVDGKFCLQRYTIIVMLKKNIIKEGTC